jgi:hypothetical protein
VLLVLLAVVGVGGLTIGLLVGMKIVDPAKLAFWKSKREIPAGWIAVPICSRPIPPYTTVTRDYLINPKTGEWVVDYKPPTAVPKGVITDLAKIRGRVTARPKAAPFYFVEDDFFPEGTRPGIAGGTPSGKRAITLDAENLKGAHELKEGDHFDLLASVAVDMPGTGRSSSGQLGTKVVAAPNTTLLPKRSLVKPLVQDGVVVTPMRIRNVPISSSSLTQGTTTRTKPVQEIILAVEPQEVAPLAEAMSLKYEITCVARSGRPSPATSSATSSASATSSRDKNTDSQSPQTALSSAWIGITNALLGKEGLADSNTPHATASLKEASLATVNQAKVNNTLAMDITPGLNPMADTRFLEVMVGPQRQFVLFTGPGNSPIVAMQNDGSMRASGTTEPSDNPVSHKQ